MEMLSVIIPAYRAAYLAQAVASVQAQNWPGRREILIVDDGSGDGTGVAARRLGATVLTRPHGGAAAARNTGLRAAAGEWILLLDADDVLAHGALAALRAPFAERPDLTAVFGRARDFLSPELTAAQRAGLPCRRGSYGGVLPGCALLRRQVFAQVGLFDETLPSAETVAWQMALRASGLPVEHIGAVVLHRRIHLTNTGRIHQKQERQAYAAVLRKRLAGR